MNKQQFNFMPSFFTYNNNDKNMRFVFNGSPYDCHSKAQFKLYTFARLISGLNHFLAYYYDTDKELYTKICGYIIADISKVHNVSIDLYGSKDYVSAPDRIKAIKEHTVISREFAYYIVKYIDAVSDNTIDESQAVTNVTLTNNIAKLLAVASVVVKFNYILSGPLRGLDLTYDHSVEYVIDNILNTTIEASIRYFKDINPKDEYWQDVDKIFNHLDSYIYSLSFKIFNDTAKSFYKSKFETLGKDSNRVSTNRRITIIGQLRSYFPKIRDEETAKRYLAPNEEPTKDKLKEVIKDTYFNLWIGYRWQDFSYNAVNMAAYFNKSLREIIQRQDLSNTLPDVNRPSFLQDSSDDSRNLSSQFDDKKRHLYNLRKDTMEYIIKDFVRELDHIDKEFIKNIKKFNYKKSHNFNTYILYKILLCLTGEAKTYYKVLGVNLRLLLALFYYRVKTNKQLVQYHDMIDVMLMEPIDFSSIEDDYINVVRESNGLTEKKYDKIKNLLVLYKKDNVQRTIDPNVLCSFINLMEDSSFISDLLFPDRYKLPVGIRKYENEIHNSFKSDTPVELQEKIKSYMRNKELH